MFLLNLGLIAYSPILMGFFKLTFKAIGTIAVNYMRNLLFILCFGFVLWSFFFRFVCFVFLISSCGILIEMIFIYLWIVYNDDHLGFATIGLLFHLFIVLIACTCLNYFIFCGKGEEDWWRKLVSKLKTKHWVIFHK